MMRSLFICMALCCCSLCPAQEAEDEPVTSAGEPTEAEAVVQLRERMASFAALLAQVQDADSAAAMVPQVQEAFAALLQTDEEEDEEEAAAALEEAFAPVDAELARLEEADFYGAAALRAVFAEPTEAEDGVIFPVGAFDFLRGGTEGGEQHVCPREEGGLPLLNWNEAQ
ncbi:MAG: hypothetical protein MJ051_06255 [Akkermansia sp.]|nr:hypothetical protein [Akkermansia sp.]